MIKAIHYLFKIPVNTILSPFLQICITLMVKCTRPSSLLDIFTSFVLFLFCWKIQFFFGFLLITLFPHKHLKLSHFFCSVLDWIFYFRLCYRCSRIMPLDWQKTPNFLGFCQSGASTSCRNILPFLFQSVIQDSLEIVANLLLRELFYINVSIFIVSLNYTN